MLKVSASGLDLNWNGIALAWLPALVVGGAKVSSTLVEGGKDNTAVFRISPGATWRFRWRFEGDVLFMESEIESHGAKPVALGKAFPLDARCPAGFALNGPDTVALLNTAGQGPCLLNRITDTDAQRQSKVLFQFYRPSRRLALQVGFQTFLRADTVVEYDTLGLDPARECLAWEFWDRKFVGKVRERLTVNMPEESVKIFRLVENSGRPVLLATDMHLTMGEMDVEEAAWSPETQTFRVKAVRPAGEKGGVYVHAPDNVHVVNFEGLHIAKDGRDNSLVIYIPFDFKEGVAEREIVFGSLKDVLDMSKLELA